MYTTYSKKNAFHPIFKKVNSTTQTRTQSEKKKTRDKMNYTNFSFFRRPIYDMFSSSFEQNMINDSSYKSILNDKSNLYNSNSFFRNPIKVNISIIRNIFKDINNNNNNNEIKEIKPKFHKKKLLIYGKYSKFDLDLFRKKTKSMSFFQHKKSYSIEEKNKKVKFPFRNWLIKSKLKNFYEEIKKKESYDFHLSRYNSFDLLFKNSRNLSNKSNKKILFSLPIVYKKQ